MIHGSIGDKMLFFVIPLALTSLLQQLFNAADIAVIGQFCGKHSMAAVGCNSPVIGLLVNLFVGIALGANVVIARFTGRRDEEKVSRAVHTTMAVSLLIGIAVAAAGELISGPLLRLMGVPSEILDLALLYLRIYLLGIPVILLYNFQSAIFRSQGDTKTPLICLTISGISNVALNLFFVLVVHMDVAGVALATVIANGISSTLLFVFLHRVQGPIRLEKGKYHVDWAILKEILRIGMPSGLQGMVFSLSNIVLQSAVNSLGADVIAASAAAFNVEICAYFLLNAYSQAATTFIGQNFGAGDFGRCRRVTRIALIQSIVVTQGAALLLIFFAGPLLRIFNGDPQVIAMGTMRMKFILYGEFVNCVLEILSGTMRGYGYSLIPALVALIGICGTRITWCYTVFARFGTYPSLLAAYPVSWVITAAVIVIAYFLLKRRVLEPMFRTQIPR